MKIPNWIVRAGLVIAPALFWVGVAAAVVSSPAHASGVSEKETLCIQYQKFAVGAARQRDEGVSLEQHLSWLAENNREDLVWIIETVHRNSTSPATTGVTVFIQCRDGNK